MTSEGTGAANDATVVTDTIETRLAAEAEAHVAAAERALKQAKLDVAAAQAALERATAERKAGS